MSQTGPRPDLDIEDDGLDGIEDWDELFASIEEKEAKLPRCAALDISISRTIGINEAGIPEDSNQDYMFACTGKEPVWEEEPGEKPVREDEPILSASGYIFPAKSFYFDADAASGFAQYIALIVCGKEPKLPEQYLEGTGDHAAILEDVSVLEGHRGRGAASLFLRHLPALLKKNFPQLSVLFASAIPRGTIQTILDGEEAPEDMAELQRRTGRWLESLGWEQIPGTPVYSAKL